MQIWVRVLAPTMSYVAASQSEKLEMGTERSRGRGASKHSGMPWRVEAFVVGAFVELVGLVVCGDEVLSRFSSVFSICARATT